MGSLLEHFCPFSRYYVYFQMSCASGPQSRSYLVIYTWLIISVAGAILLRGLGLTFSSRVCMLTLRTIPMLNLDGSNSRDSDPPSSFSLSGFHETILPHGGLQAVPLL